MNSCTNKQCSLYGKCNLGTNCILYKGKAKGNKYHAEKCEYKGEIFDSQKERDRYIELTLLLKAGEITDLQRQVKYELIPAQREADTIGKRGGVKKGKLIEAGVGYVADFVYKDKNGNLVVEDVKGYRQGGAYAVFTIKRKLFLYKYGIRIKEV